MIQNSSTGQLITNLSLKQANYYETKLQKNNNEVYDRLRTLNQDLERDERTRTPI